MVQGWQEVICDGEEAFDMRHHHFQQILDELQYRDVLDMNWRLVVDLEKVDMTLKRRVV